MCIRDSYNPDPSHLIEYLLHQLKATVRSHSGDSLPTLLLGLHLISETTPVPQQQTVFRKSVYYYVNSLNTTQEADFKISHPSIQDQLQPSTFLSILEILE